MIAEIQPPHTDVPGYNNTRQAEQLRATIHSLANKEHQQTDITVWLAFELALRHSRAPAHVPYLGAPFAPVA